MPHRAWAERVDDELARRGVPARFRRRLLAELRDHATDLTDGEDLAMTDEVLNRRLGTPAELADHAAANYRRSTWVARHPLAVFGLLPVPMAITVTLLVLATAVLLWEGIDAVVGGLDAMSRQANFACIDTLVTAERFVPGVLTAALLARLAVRTRVNRWYVMAGVAQVAVYSGSIIYRLNYSDTPGESECSLGLAWLPVPTGPGWSEWSMPPLTYLGWAQVIQITVPAAAAVLVVWAARRRAEGVR